MDLIAEVFRNLNEHRMIREGQTVLAAVSGGADSIALLHILDTLRRERRFPLSFQLRCVHVHHGIRGTRADDDAAFVEAFCASRGIPFRLRRVNAPEYAAGNTHRSLEEAARFLRYEALLAEARACLTRPQTTAEESGANDGGVIPEEAARCVCIATAHHLDDLAETVLLKLFRGTGIRGLTGILPVRELVSQGKDGETTVPLIRPLLTIPRSLLEAYLRAAHITWRTDETNADETYQRNRIRRLLLPEIRAAYNARAAEHIGETAADVRMLTEYLDARTGEALLRCVTEEKQEKPDFSLPLTLSIPALLREDLFLQAELLRRCMADVGAERKHIRAVQRLCESDNGRAFLTLPKGLRVIRRGKTLTIEQSEG